MPVKLAQYGTFEDMHGHKSNLAELIDRVKPFSRESVIYWCAVIGMILKTWQRGEWDQTHYDYVVSQSFDSLRGDWYRASARTANPELVFHRRQLLLLMKIAVEHCPEKGIELESVPRHVLGTLLLMANDQFHHGLYPSDDAQGGEEDKLTRVLAELIPVTEYGGSKVENVIARSHLMMTRYAKELTVHPDYIDVSAEYENQTGISLNDYEALAFALFARCSSVTLDGLRRNAWLAAVRSQNFETTGVNNDLINRFLEEFSDDAEGFKNRILKGKQKHKDFGANDLTIFREKPLIVERHGLLPTDLIFIAEKFASGPYWRLNSINKEFGDRLRRFWGAVFEAYVNDQVAAAAKLSGATFIPNPHLDSDPNAEICDGLLIEGDALVLLEYKSCMFTAHAKYAGDHLLLSEEIKKKLVRDDSENKKKGVEQLAMAVQHLCLNTEKIVIADRCLADIKRVYPLLVTLDDVGGTLLISRLLNLHFDQFVNRSEFAKIIVNPMVCTDIESLETVLSFADVHTLSSSLQYWINQDPKLTWTLSAFMPEGMPKRRNELLFAEWQRLFDAIGARLFPSEHAIAKARTDNGS